jgi:hypothetical protein
MRIGRAAVLASVLTALATMTAGIVAAVAICPSAVLADVADPPSGFVAYQVELDQTGGFAGVRQHYVVDRGNDGSAEVLALAGSGDFLQLADAYLPKNPCCDFFTYVVRAHYVNGKAKSVITMDTADAPAVLWKMIALVKQVGTRS